MPKPKKKLEVVEPDDGSSMERMAEAVLPTPEQPTIPQKNRWIPTRKWAVTQVTALTALALMYVTTGGWDQEETVSAIGIASQALLGYLVPNNPENVNSP